MLLPVELSPTAPVTEEQLRFLTDEQRRLLTVINTLSTQTTEPILLQQIMPRLHRERIMLNLDLDELLELGLVEWHNPGWRITQRGADFVETILHS